MADNPEKILKLADHQSQTHRPCPRATSLATPPSSPNPGPSLPATIRLSTEGWEIIQGG